MTFKRTRCPHCKGKLDAHQRIHPDCIDGYALAEEAKAKRKAMKQAVMAAKVERAETRRRKEAVKSKPELAKEAEKEFNAWIRARDEGKPCISCGRHHQGQWHAGHYLSVGARPELRFVEKNVHRQCAPCNTHLSGNAILYRKGLIEREGAEIVEWLEGPHPLPKWTHDELRAIREKYRALNKELRKA